jgi:hypothetical protein
VSCADYDDISSEIACYTQHMSSLITSCINCCLFRACEKYAAAKLLVECVMMTASEPSDKRVLQGFAQMFADQYSQCEKSRAGLLEYGEGAVGSQQQHAFLPTSTSSPDNSYRHRSISH